MSIHLIAIPKAVFFVSTGIGLAIVAMDPTVKVAIIVSIAPTISAFMWGWVNHAKLNIVEVNTNNTLTQLRLQVAALLKDKEVAVSRADRAEARTEGDQSREDKGK